MVTLKECINSLEELQDIWNQGNQESLPFCRYMRRAIDELAWEFIYCTDDVPADVEETFYRFEDDVYECWRYLKVKHGECSITLMPIGE